MIETDIEQYQNNIKATLEKLVSELDKYFSNPETGLSNLFTSISNLKGEEYLNSRVKRILDISVSLPECLLSTPIILIFALSAFLEDNGPMFYLQDRLSPDGQYMKMWKIRSMFVDADSRRLNGEINPKDFRPEDDPRVTRTGKLIRRFDIDELPQFFQILFGSMTLFGIRPRPKDIETILKQNWSEERFNKWITEINISHKGGLSGLNQALSKNTKDDPKRFHFDVYYSKNANLRMDLYLIWRTAIRTFRINPREP